MTQDDVAFSHVILRERSDRRISSYFSNPLIFTLKNGEDGIRTHDADYST